MKNKFKSLFLLIPIILMVAACAFDGINIAKTTWTNQIFHIGTGVAFRNDSEGFTFSMIGNVYSNMKDFSYSFQSSSSSGEIIFFLDNQKVDFVISNNILTLEGVKYNFDPLNNRL